MDETKSTLYVVAGPNGCGKSTLIQNRFRGLRVIDPDAIARRIAPDAPEDAAIMAGREAIRERRAAIVAGESFVVETTLSGGSVLRLMEQAKARGYRVELHFVCVDSADESLDRVASRVAQGGHDVASEDVRRRFVRAQENLAVAIATSDEARLYDNASVDEPYRSVAVLTAADRWFATDLPKWALTTRDNVSS